VSVAARISSFIFLFFLISSFSFAQTEKTAKDQFDALNFQAALKSYLILHKKDPKNIDYNLNIGRCYLNTNIDKSKAIPYLEFVTQQVKFDNDVWFALGNAYQYANKFDEAIAAYNKYILKAKDPAKANRQIETCNNGKELIKNPVNVTFENIGKEVNSEFADYYPFIPANEAFVAFTSRRKGNVGNIIEYDGYYSSDIYLSDVKGGKWLKVKNAGANLNTANDEQVVGLTSDGKTMLIYIDHKEFYGDIYFSKNKGKGFDKPEPYGTTINTPSLETSASITSDGNIILFASDKPGGLGGTDIYMSKKLPNGEWGETFNLGPVINSKYNEEFPHLSEDNNTLYFSSEGHNSMGGYDLFRANYDTINQKWLVPRNMGFPINTSEDNLTFCVSSSNRDGYVSAVRPGGYGDLDIYKVIFNDVDARQTVLQGFVHGNNQEKILDYEITVIDKKGEELDRTYKPNQKTGKYIASLPAGVYILMIDAPGYKTYKEEVTILDKSDYLAEIKKDINLVPPVSPAAPVIKSPTVITPKK